MKKLLLSVLSIGLISSLVGCGDTPSLSSESTSVSEESSSTISEQDLSSGEEEVSSNDVSSEDIKKVYEYEDYGFANQYASFPSHHIFNFASTGDEGRDSYLGYSDETKTYQLSSLDNFYEIMSEKYFDLSYTMDASTWNEETKTLSQPENTEVTLVTTKMVDVETKKEMIHYTYMLVLGSKETKVSLDEAKQKEYQDIYENEISPRVNFIGSKLESTKELSFQNKDGLVKSIKEDTYGYMEYPVTYENEDNLWYNCPSVMIKQEDKLYSYSFDCTDEKVIKEETTLNANYTLANVKAEVMSCLNEKENFNWDSKGVMTGISHNAGYVYDSVKEQFIAYDFTNTSLDIVRTNLSGNLELEEHQSFGFSLSFKDYDITENMAGFSLYLGQDDPNPTTIE